MSARRDLACDVKYVYSAFEYHVHSCCVIRIRVFIRAIYAEDRGACWMHWHYRPAHYIETLFVYVFIWTSVAAREIWMNNSSSTRCRRVEHRKTILKSWCMARKHLNSFDKDYIVEEKRVRTRCVTIYGILHSAPVVEEIHQEFQSPKITFISHAQIVDACSINTFYDNRIKYISASDSLVAYRVH